MYVYVVGNVNFDRTLLLISTHSFVDCFVHVRYSNSKSTMTDKLFGPAWLAFGHAFAAEGEHDQASAAYFTSARFMKG